MTRPEIPIDWQQVDYMLRYGANGVTIAQHLGMHHETFYDRVVKKFNIGFTEYAAQKRAIGDDEIREAQFRKAVKKLDNTMLIWLGKQRLGQKENHQEKTVSEEILRAFDEFTKQLAHAQAERSPTPEPKKDEPVMTVTNVISQPVRPSPFQ